MGIHNPTGNLYKLADMSNEQQPLSSQVHSHIDDFTDIVAALDGIMYGHKFLFIQIMFSVVAQSHDQISTPHGKLLFHLYS